MLVVKFEEWANVMHVVNVQTFPNSGVATLGHAGAHALATRGRAPPVQR